MPNCRQSTLKTFQRILPVRETHRGIHITHCHILYTRFQSPPRLGTGLILVLIVVIRRFNCRHIELKILSVSNSESWRMRTKFIAIETRARKYYIEFQAKLVKWSKKYWFWLQTHDGLRLNGLEPDHRQAEEAQVLSGWYVEPCPKCSYRREETWSQVCSLKIFSSTTVGCNGYSYRSAHVSGAIIRPESTQNWENSEIMNLLFILRSSI